MQRWWIAIVALVGVALAILLFPRPDTGDVESDEPAAAEQKPVVAKAKRKAKRKLSEAGERILERRSRPDAVHAGKLVAPWTAIRFFLLDEFKDDDDAIALAADIQEVMQVLQVGRRNPERAPPLAQTVERLLEFEKRIDASPFIQSESVQRGMKRHRMALTEYRAAVQAEGTAAPEEAP